MQTKSFLKIWLFVNFEKFTSINEDRDQSQSSIWRAVTETKFFRKGYV